MRSFAPKARGEGAAPVLQAKRSPAPRSRAANRLERDFEPDEAGEGVLAENWAPGRSFADIPLTPPGGGTGGAGLPPALRVGLEALSGFAMDDVRVHRDSPEPARLGALAYARGSEIHLGPGQEQHLPHEAWHVVQQRQGRVTATTQVKGAAISDQTVLEAEADRMGDHARNLVSRSAQGKLRKSLAGDGVVQRKVFQGNLDKENEWKPWSKESSDTAYSGVVTNLINESASYLIRNDCKKSDLTVYVLEDKYYLFSEGHGEDADRSWDTNVEKWENVPRLVEEDFYTADLGLREFKTLEEYAFEVDPRGNPPYHMKSRGQAPFDSLATVYLNTCVSMAKVLEDIVALKDDWPKKKGRLYSKFDEIGFWFLDTYPIWLNRLPSELASQSPNPGSGEQQSISDFVKKYMEELATLKADLRALWVATGYRPAEPEEKGADASGDVDRLFVCLAKSSACIGPMIEDLAKLVQMSAGEVSAVNSFLKQPSKKYSEDDLLKSTSPTRELVMMANMAKQKPPVFIKTGSHHAEAIAKDNNFKDKVKLLPELTPLEPMTRRR